MNKLITATLVTLVMTSPVHASQYCDDVSALAEMVMKIRQSGAELSSIKKECRMGFMNQAICTTAWSQPIADTVELRKQASLEFGVNWFKICINLESKKDE